MAISRRSLYIAQRRLASRGPHIDIPLMTLPAYMEHEGKWDILGEKPAVIEGASGRTLRYNRVRPSITAAGRGLTKAKVKTLCIFMPNLPEFMIAMLGALQKGVVVTPANPAYTAEELAHQLQNSKADQILTIGPLLEVALEAADRVKMPRSSVVVLGQAGSEHFAILEQGGPVDPDTHVNPEKSVAVLPYSSGTTGLPKGVMLSHKNLVANVRQLIATDDATIAIHQDSIVLGVLPLFHIYGMVVNGFCAMALGSTLVTIPKFDPELFLTVIQKYKVTVAPLVPPIMIFLSKHPIVEKFDLTSLKVIYSAAAPCDKALTEAVHNKLPHCTVLQAYGMTELSPAATVAPAQKLIASKYKDRSGVKAGSVGAALPGTELRVACLKTGKTLDAFEHGELHVKGPQVMLGYLDNEEATKAIMADDGWLKTGDIFYHDGEGSYYAVDRLKELIKVKGFQVAPAELEGLVLNHPAVADCAVIPIPDERSGEAPLACVVLKPSTTATEEDIKQAVAQHTADYKHLKQVVFLDSIPKSASGKILRRLLKDKVAKATAA